MPRRLRRTSGAYEQRALRCDFCPRPIELHVDVCYSHGSAVLRRFDSLVPLNVSERLPRLTGDHVVVRLRHVDVAKASMAIYLAAWYVSRDDGTLRDTDSIMYCRTCREMAGGEGTTSAVLLYACRPFCRAG